MQLIDSHCHLDMVIKREDVDLTLSDLLATANQSAVTKMLCVSVSTVDWPAMKTLCQAHEDKIYLSAGIHPCYMDDQDFTLLESQANDEQVIAIGETGLDYYHCSDESIKKQQHHSFLTHIELANRLQKPLIIHTRDARKDTIALLREGHADNCRGVMHCFTETLEMAKAALDLGFYISFSGIITFKNAEQIREVAAYTPLDRILIETDAPYLAPVPYRGKVNQPAYVSQVAEKVAEIKAISVEEIGQTTTDNFYRLFSKAS